MSTPTPERPTRDDDELDLAGAYALAHALAGDQRGPAPAVRATVLAAAREIAAQAAARVDAPAPLTPVAPPVANVGRGRAGAWNLSSWRVRSGAASCAVLLVGIVAVRFDASRKASDEVRLAAAGPALSVRVMPAPAPADLPPPPPKTMAPLPEPTRIVPPSPVDTAAAAPAPAAPAVRERAPADVASRDPDRAVARADRPAGPAADSGDQASVRAQVADARAAPREPASGEAVPAAPGPRADVARKIAALAPSAPAATGATTGGGARAAPTPLHVAADADDVDALARLLADPATRVDAPDALGRTPLQYAAAAGRARAVRLLLAAGADPDHEDASGASPRSVARAGSSAEIAALFAAR